VGYMYGVGYGRYGGSASKLLGLAFSIVSVSITGSNITASSNSFLLRFRLMIQVAITMRNMRPTRPTKPKTRPDRTLFSRKPFGEGGLLELIADVCAPWDAVKVMVCPAVVVTTRGGEGSVGVDIEDEDEDEEVVELDVDEEVVEVVEVEWEDDVDDVLDVLPVDLAFVDVDVGVGKRSERKSSCLSWSNFKS
jgi:hypothetical protein